MDFFFFLLLFVFGSSIGSFYLTTADRILFYFYGKKRKVGTRRSRFYSLFTVSSHCESCGNRILPHHLIPVIGYILTKGKCHFCEKKIAFIFPLSEILFGLAVLIPFYVTNSLLFSVSFVFLLGHLLISIVTDATYFSLDYENLPFILFFGCIANYALLGEWPGWTEFYVFIGFGFFYLLIYLLVKQGMGLGDVFFAPVFAFLAGHPFWILFLNSSYTLALIITFLTRKKGENLKGKMIPMGVYFSISLFFTYIAKVLYYYLGIDGLLENNYES